MSNRLEPRRRVKNGAKEGANFSYDQVEIDQGRCWMVVEMVMNRLRYRYRSQVTALLAY